MDGYVRKMVKKAEGKRRGGACNRRKVVDRKLEAVQDRVRREMLGGLEKEKRRYWGTVHVQERRYCTRGK